MPKCIFCDERDYYRLQIILHMSREHDIKPSEGVRLLREHDTGEDETREVTP